MKEKQYKLEDLDSHLKEYIVHKYWLVIKEYLDTFKYGDIRYDDYINFLSELCYFSKSGKLLEHEMGIFTSQSVTHNLKENALVPVAGQGTVY